MDTYSYGVLLAGIIILIIAITGIALEVTTTSKEYPAPGEAFIIQATGGCLRTKDCHGNGVCVYGRCVCFSDEDCERGFCNLSIGKCE